jgi:uncharacterized membrane protein YozB (DUF420 family)
MSTMLIDHRPSERADPPTRAAVRQPSWFYVGMSVVGLAVLASGFAPTLYLRPASLPSLPPHVIAHGILFSSWHVLFFVQSVLVASGRVKLHRRLGYFAACIAAVMMLTAPPMAIALASRGLPQPDPLLNMLVIATDLALFGTFVSAAIYFRRRGETHKRFMLLATTCMLAPAISRWPIAVRNPAPAILSALAVLLAAPIVYDLLTGRRPHKVSVWGGLAVLASGPIRFAIGSTAAWHALAGWLIR